MDYRLETYRTHQQRVPSTMGELIPESIGSREEYASRILAPMFHDIAAFDPEGILQHEWLNVRAAVPRFERNAIEIRIADVQECPLADIAIVAAVVGLVRHLYASGQERSPAETQDLLSILRACIVDAEQTVIADAAYLRLMQFPGHRSTAAELWLHLLEILPQDSLSPWLPTLQFILRHGPLARRLVQTVGTEPQRPKLEAAYAELCRCLNDGHLFRGRL